MTGNRSLKASAASVTGAFCAVVSKLAHLLAVRASVSVLSFLRVFFIPTRSGIVLRAESLNERALRMRVTDAPRHDRDLEVAGVDIGQLLAADRAPRHDLDAEGVERLLRVVRCARPVCKVARRVHLELELLPILGVDAV